MTTPPEERPTLGLSQILLGDRPDKGGIRRRSPTFKGTLLFVLPLPMLRAALLALGRGRLGAFTVSAAGFALFLAAAYLTRRGIQASREPSTRRYGARRGVDLPLQNLGGGVLAVATGLCAFFGARYGAAISLAFGAVAALGFHLSYGFVAAEPPRASFGRSAETREVGSALDEAERRIMAIEEVSRAIGNPELRGRLERIAGRGRRVLERIAERPQSMRRARKFLTVYLEGTQQVCEGYARTHRAAESRELEQSFRNVLSTIEDVFAEQEKKLLETDLMDLDVQIEVLNKQLKREGII
ncbi:MAG: 5-bromo-4-chloroindolyl phosphate hydrolysis family protein [Chromatiaceae bacterium]